MLFMTSSVNVFAEEDTTDGQINDEPLIADYPEGVVENNTPSLSTEPIETENNILASTAVIEDGVYAIMSYSNTNRWITIEDDSPWEDANVQQEYSATYPTTSFDRSSLFKISRVGTTDRYIIRSMINNRMTIDLTSDGKVITKKIPAADSSVSLNDTFLIEADGAGYYIRPYTYAYVINLVSPSTANLSTTLKSSATSSAKWTFVKYTGESKNGMTLYRPASWGSIGNVVGNTSDATLVGWSTHINANTLSMDIKSGYEDLGTLSWNSSTNKMTLIAENPGQIRINGRIKYANGTEVYSGYFSHMIVPQEGTYYIQNAGTEKYIDIEGPSTSAGAIIQQWQYHTGNQEKWNIEHVSNSGGYVRLKSVYSGLYIGVNSSNTSSIKQYSTQNDYTLWKIDRSTSGNLVFRCKATESSGIVLSVPLTSNSNGTNLTQVTYSNDTNSKDEWKLRSIKYSFTANHYIDEGYEIRFNSTGEDISEYQDICSQILLELFGINSSYTVSTYCSCADTCTGTPTTLLDTTTACAHSNTDHKTRSNIKNDIVSLYNAGNDTTAKIAWTGHVLESRSSCSYSSQHVIIMTIGMVTDESNNNKTPDVIRYQRIYTLLHETSHQLGAPDHYCYDESSSNCNNPTNDCWRCDNGLTSKPVCVMTDRTYDIESRLLAGNADTLYCDQCKSSTHPKGILTHLEDHHK